MTTFKTSLFVLLLATASSIANAAPINDRETGLTSPQTTIDFGNALVDSTTVITNQFAGVTFSTDGDPWHYKTFPSPEIFNGIELGHLTRRDVAFNPTIFSIEFDGPVIGAAFNMRSFPGNSWIVTSSRNGALVETFVLIGATDPHTTVRFYGFENSSFDTLTIESTVDDAGFEFDNLQISLLIVDIDIDIKPGSDPNCFNINGNGVIPVAIFGRDTFDVLNIDTYTLFFAGLEVRVRGKKGPSCHGEDSNDDGFLDLVCQFEDDPNMWEPDSSAQATLYGQLMDGTEFEGTDSICVVP